MKIGSLCSGYGGLDLGVMEVLGGEVAWHVEYDTAPSKILEHHWPTIPNYGDLTTLDWSTLPPIEVLTAGYPCQPFSIAGKRKGADDERHLWPYIKDAIRQLRPRLVVLENVRGHLTLGIDRVLGDLAELGYDTRWVCLPASAAGAPHRRERIFIAAYPAGQPWSIGDRNDVRAGGGAVEREPAAGRGSVEDTDRSARDQRGISAPGQAENGRSRADVGRRGGAPSADAYGDGLGSVGGIEHVERHIDGPDGSDSVWRDYEPAIRRWEHVIGRLAPSPTAPDGRNGAHRLSARFVEWMMGLPEGHVTDVGLTRAQQLKALGNGVVPQQAALALTLLGAAA
ncbi:DNA cytosine methyltransferase [Microbacterium sp. ProA8]|uniref:DNA cytosine methyltransferase n=1 Tax=Microbacterium chionoecetis TaxID=3153754 RepID=UPI003267CB47